MSGTFFCVHGSLHECSARAVATHSCEQVCKYSGEMEYNVEVQTSSTESKRDCETFSATGHIPRSHLTAMGSGHDGLNAWSSHVADSRLATMMAIEDGLPLSQLTYIVCMLQTGRCPVAR